jgi:hypothetical protein
MRLSRNWDAGTFFKAGFRDIGLDRNSPIFSERFDLINTAVEKVHGLFEWLIGNSYLTKTSFNSPTVGNHSTSGTGLFTYATKAVTFSGMRTSFTSADVEKLCVMRINNNLYGAFIDSYTSATAIVIRGQGLPSSVTSTIDWFGIVNSVPSDGEILLTSLNINRTSAVKIVLESSVTDFVKSASIEEYKRFRSASDGDKTKIIYSLSGDTLLLKKGDSLSTFGTMTLYYPRVPYKVTSDTHQLDLPDGACCQIALNRMRISIATRMNRMDLVKFYYDEMYQEVQGLYKSFGAEIDLETIKAKVSSLV